jgi:tRNA(Ile2) C34 agmatinyltransferase TiaS
VALLTGLLSAAILLAFGLQLAPVVGPAWMVFVGAAAVDVLMAVVLYKRIRFNRLKCPHCGRLRVYTPEGFRCPDCES